MANERKFEREELELLEIPECVDEVALVNAYIKKFGIPKTPEESVTLGKRVFNLWNYRKYHLERLERMRAKDRLVEVRHKVRTEQRTDKPLAFAEDAIAVKILNQLSYSVQLQKEEALKLNTIIEELIKTREIFERLAKEKS